MRTFDYDSCLKWLIISTVNLPTIFSVEKHYYEICPEVYHPVGQKYGALKTKYVLSLDINISNCGMNDIQLDTLTNGVINIGTINNNY